MVYFSWARRKACLVLCTRLCYNCKVEEQSGHMSQGSTAQLIGLYQLFSLVCCKVMQASLSMSTNSHVYDGLQN